MRMRQSIAEIEDAFFEEIEDDRERRENLRKRAERRAAERHAKRTHRHGSMRFLLLDVFTDRPLTGNQLAVFLDGGEVPEALRQDLAREIGFSETVFCDPPSHPTAGDVRAIDAHECSQQLYIYDAEIRLVWIEWLDLAVWPCMLDCFGYVLAQIGGVLLATGSLRFRTFPGHRSPSRRAPGEGAAMVTCPIQNA